MRNKISTLFVETGLLLLIHFVLINWMAEDNPVARILALGEHTPLWVSTLCVIFLGVRILLLVLLPGIIALRLGMILFDQLGRQRPEPVPETAPTQGSTSASAQ